MKNLRSEDLTMTIENVFRKLRAVSKEQTAIRIHPSVPSIDDIMFLLQQAQTKPVVRDDRSGIDALECLVKASCKEADPKVIYYLGWLAVVLDMLPCRKHRMLVRLFD